jgi:hypothetical protein
MEAFTFIHSCLCQCSWTVLELHRPFHSTVSFSEGTEGKVPPKILFFIITIIKSQNQTTNISFQSGGNKQTLLKNTSQGTCSWHATNSHSFIVLRSPNFLLLNEILPFILCWYQPQCTRVPQILHFVYISKPARRETNPATPLGTEPVA